MKIKLKYEIQNVNGRQGDIAFRKDYLSYDRVVEEEDVVSGVRRRGAGAVV